MLNTVRLVPNDAPKGFFGTYTTADLGRLSKKCWAHHHVRHSHSFYAEVAETLREARYLPFPLDELHTQYPAGIPFRFEKMNFMAMLPQPHDSESPILICPEEHVDDARIERAAKIFSILFLMEYRRFYATVRTTNVKKG